LCLATTVEEVNKWSSGGRSFQRRGAVMDMALRRREKDFDY